MKDEKGVFFVGVDGTPELRRHILESLKYGIESLQSYEKLKSVGEEKDKDIVKLKSTLKYISGLVNDMKSALPKTGLRAKPKQKVMKEEVKVKKEKPKIEKPIKVSEFDKLDEELRDIESKLNSLA